MLSSPYTSVCCIAFEALEFQSSSRLVHQELSEGSPSAPCAPVRRGTPAHPSLMRLPEPSGEPRERWAPLPLAEDQHNEDQGLLLGTETGGLLPLGPRKHLSGRLVGG